MFQNLHLDTSRLLIRNFTMDDLNDLHAIINDEEVLRYLPDDPISPDRASLMLKWIIDCYQENTPDNIIKFTCAVDHKADHKLIGWCGLGPLEFDPSVIELFYGFSTDYWGNGYATEAARAMLRYGFETIGLQEIVAVTMPENTASQSVIEKLDMKYRKQVTGLPKKFNSYEGDRFYSISKDNYRNSNRGI